MKKVIFLDIDGVLNNLEDILHNKYIETPEQPQDKHLKVLKEIIKITKAEIVLSSGWRLTQEGLQDVIDALYRYKIHLRGVTPEGVLLSSLQSIGINVKPKLTDNHLGDITVDDRGAEIAIWLHKHKEYKNFLILDDEVYDIKEYFPENYIKTNCNEGLLEKHIEKAVEILNKSV